MMSAREMFKKLGYEKKEESEGVLLYISDFENSILFEKKRVTITDLYCYGRITININHLLENAIHKQCKELGWLEEEKQEKAETNYEHFKDEIVQNVKYNLAVVNGEPKPCEDTNCDECDFNCDCCGEKRFEWLASPYKESTYKLTKFENDLLQSYVEGNLRKCKFKDICSLNRMKEKEYFKCVDENETIDEILENCEVVG